MSEVVIKTKDTILVSDRDIKMVEAFSHGKHCADIAKSVKLSKRTVELHVTNLRHKFNCATIPQLVATFLRKGLIK